MYITLTKNSLERSKICVLDQNIVTQTPQIYIAQKDEHFIIIEIFHYSATLVNFIKSYYKEIQLTELRLDSLLNLAEVMLSLSIDWRQHLVEAGQWEPLE